MARIATDATLCYATSCQFSESTGVLCCNTYVFHCNIHAMATATRELLEHRLPTGRTLAAYVAVKRKRGAGWRRIADELHTDTGVAISHTTLRRWFPDRASASKASA